MSEQEQVLIAQEPVAQPTPGQPEPEERLEIEVVNDTPPEDQNKARAPEAQAAEQPPDQIPEDELATYSDRVKKRINRLKYEFHEERRGRESAERQNNEAIQYAQRVIQENQVLKTHLQAGAKVLHQQVSAKADAELEQAKRAFKDAYESGDADAITKAQENLSRLVYAKEQVRQFAPPEQQGQQQEQQQQIPQQAQPQPVADPKAVKWAKERPWFGTDHRMTSYALAVHEDLLGKNMDTTSDEYYKFIDNEMRERFPEKFQAEEKVVPIRRAASVVAPVSRSANGAGRKVQLTETQVAVAKRLGVSPEQYAREMLKLQQEVQ